LLCKVFRENRKLNLELESSFSEIASLRSKHDDMSVKPCDSCTMITVNYADLWFLYSHVASLLNSARLELRELKAHSTLLGACTSCPVLRSDLEALFVEINDLKHKLDHSSHYTILSPPCIVCGSLKGKLFHATKENTELKQEVAYLTARLEKTILSEKMIEEDLSRVEESATKSTYKLGVGFQRCEKKGKKSASKFVPTSNYHKEEEALKPTKTHYPSNPKPSFKTKRDVKKETPKPIEEAFFAYFVTVLATLMSFAFIARELRRCTLTMLKAHIMMSSLIFYLALSLALHLALLLVLCLISLMNLTIAHMILVYERTTLCLDTLVVAHVLIMVIVFCVGLVSLLESFTLTLSRDSWTVHVSPS
jgi:hypothetical protein